MIAAVVFDMDGVIVSSEEVWDEVREDLVRERGGRWVPEAHPTMMGMSTPEWTAYMRDGLGVPMPPEEIAAEVERRLVARYEADLPLLPGAVEAVRGLAAVCPLGLASSSTPGLIAAVLRHRRPGRRLPGDRLLAGGRAGQAGAGRLPARARPARDGTRRTPSPSRTPRRGSAPPPPPGCGSWRSRTGSTRPSDEDLALADVVLERIADLTPEALPG